MSTPFAMEVSGEIGGIPDLTAVFVVITGVVGAALGDLILSRLPFASSLSRGVLWGPTDSHMLSRRKTSRSWAK